MTQGTIVRDDTFLQETGGYYDNPFRAGYRFVKTWSGGDSPTPSKPKASVTYHYFRYVVARHTKAGRYFEVVKFRRIRDRISREPKRARRREPNGYTMSLTESRDPVIDWSRDGGLTFDRKGSVGSLYGGFSNPLTWDSNDDLAVINKLREKINGSGFDMSVFLGTSHQSLRTIAGSATKIALALVSLRQGKIIEASHYLMGDAHVHRGTVLSLRDDKGSITAKNMSAAWLELQYGWKPLVKDLFDAAQSLATYLNVPMTQRYVARHVKRGVPTAGSPYLSAPDNAFCIESSQIVAYLKEKPGILATLGLTNPATLMWELLPWSFVVDWALPIGDYLAARSFASTLTGTFVTTRRSLFQVLGAHPAPLKPGMSTPFLDNGLGSAYRKKSVLISRVVGTTLGVPYPSVKPLSKIASFAHAQNAMALLTQVTLAKEVKDARNLEIQLRQFGHAARRT